MRVPLVLLLLSGGIAAGDGPAAIRVAPVVPPVFRILADPAVQKEIGLTAEQQTRAEALWKALAAPIKPNRVGGFGTIPAETFRAARIASASEFLAKGLTKDQRARLDQILFQLREKEFGRHTAFAMAARDLGLRTDQVDDVRSLKGLRVEEIARTVTSGQRYEKIKVEVEARNGDTFEKMTEMLTRAQRERLKELRGKQFDTSVMPAGLDTRKSAGPDASTRRPPYVGPIIGMFDLELHYIVQPSVRDEVKLTAAQANALLAARDETLEGVVGGKVHADWVDKVHAMTELALAKLNPGQRSRFDQIMMQRRARVSREAVCGHPTAVATLKLSPVQIGDLRSGKSIEEVLTRDQLAGYDKLLGEEFALPIHVPDGYAPAARKAPVASGKIDPPDFAIARSFLVLTNRLNLSDEQVKKLRDLAEDEPKIRELIHNELSLDDTPPAVGSARSLTAVSAVSDHYRAAVEQQCWDVLDAPQKSLARQIFGRKK